jgi:ABC-type uncharacterized transport system involved in gliding motility auxiliary subunit
VTQYVNHPITRDLGNLRTLFPLTRSLGAEAKPPRGVTAQPLALTSPQSWGETDRAALQKGEAKPDPQDKRGPLPVAAAVDIPAEPRADDASKSGEAAKRADDAAGAEARRSGRARLVVVGTANLATNQFLGAEGNRDFFLNSVSWLAEQEDQLSVRPKEPTRQPIILTSAQSQLVFWLPVVVLPLAVMLVGIGVVIQRRRAN